VAEMANDEETLKYYGAVTGFNIHVVDNEPSELIQSFDDMT
jgi:tubulin-folding cofactor B